MPTDALEALKNAKKGTVTEVRGNDVYIAEDEEGKKHVVISPIVIGVGHKGFVVDTGDLAPLFVSEPTM